MKKTILSLPVFLLMIMCHLQAKVNLPAIFGSNMVFQQNAKVKMWGWANPQEEIKVSATWGTEIQTAKTDNYGKWEVMINTPSAGGPYAVTVTGGDTVVMQNVMVGEVWLCSGQSNMEMSASWGINNAKEEIAAAGYPDIRLFQVDKRAAPDPQIDLSGNWAVCSPGSMKSFSAAAYFFGRELYNKLHVPIGLINSSWGGTAAETWINPDVIAGSESLTEAAKKISDKTPWCPGKPGSTYNSMIAPVIPFGLAGVIWYQGETNTANPGTYAEMFSALIKDWRNEWKREFPFYYVQIAPYKYGDTLTGALVREAQLRCLSLPNTGMVVISDIGNLNDIHPKNKQNIGIRLANWALSNTYHFKGIPYSGPLYRGMRIDKNKIIISFDHTDGGLVARDGPLTDFQIAGSDSVFTDADAKIKDNTVVVTSKKIKNPVAVRFAFTNTAEPNLFNGAGLPASCFRTDNWKINSKNNQ